MGDTIQITHNQGSILLQGAAGAKFPAEVGTRKFNEQAQAKINEKFRLLGKILKKVSTKRDGRWLFGNKDFWKAIQMDTKTLNGSSEMVEAQRETIYNLLPDKMDETLEIELTGAARSAIYWLCYQWAHPASALCQSIGFHDEIVWPLIEAIGKVGDFRKDLGLQVEGDDDAYFGDEEKGAKKEPAEAKA